MGAPGWRRSSGRTSAELASGGHEVRLGVRTGESAGLGAGPGGITAQLNTVILCTLNKVPSTAGSGPVSPLHA
jgi:hypothetical protein